ncbi:MULTISPECIES: DUF885 family protein [unclassified Oceanobacter]|uniref:DUF885 family protein n=1 Tax=unclassified Oceanobacter TaxID=2620260 RepID=UPI0027338762|nr:MULTISPECIES: DUF885 family protein [unclassified Oceanobacter]MDP2507034.1 DUF885 family protein [Oceanobacter sp. 3_MG-2023]MDP2548146.1 DUF885 family protein [Oceanobacter sp. 4_MG-2023]
MSLLFAPLLRTLPLTLLLLGGCQATLPTIPDTLDDESVSYSDTQQADARSQLNNISADYFQQLADRFPERARTLGIEPEAAWSSLSEITRNNHYQQLQAQKQQLQQLPLDALTAQEQLIASTLIYRINQQLDWRECSKSTMPLGSEHDWLHIIESSLANDTPVDNIPGFHRYLTRLESAAILLQQWQRQISERSQHHIPILDSSRQHTLSQLDIMLTGYPFTDSPEPSPLWQDIQTRLTQLELYPASHEILEAKAASTLTNHLLPALRALRRQLKDLTTQTSLSWQQYPNGDACYRLQLTEMGSTESPELLQEIAKARLSDIQQQLIQALSLDPAQLLAPQLRAWLASQRSRPLQQQDSARQRLQQLNQQLPQQFAYLPSTALVIQPNQRRGIQAPWYQAPQPALAQPGIYWTLATNPDHHWRWPLDLYRNTLPGKHLQVAMAQENDQLPDFMQTPLNNDFEPGWLSLAAELATDLGGYQSSAEHAWVLLDDMEQELNLILDIGIHLYQWPQDQAIDYCQSNSFLSAQDCQQRLQQIMEAPGQLARPAISRANLLGLIRSAESEQGSAFSPQQFYSDWLAAGLLPPALYGQWLRLWIEQ